MVASNYVTVDFSNQGIMPRISVMQGDTVRQIVFKLYNNGEEWEHVGDVPPYIAFTRPNGKNIKIHSRDYDFVIQTINNEVYIELPIEATIVSGEIPFVLGFENSSGNSLAAFPVLLDVIANPAFNSEGLTIANLDKSLDEIIDIQENLIGGESE